MCTEPSTEKPPPCCHCRMVRASCDRQQPAADEEVQQPPADVGLHGGERMFIELLGFAEHDSAIRLRGEHAVDDHAMKMQTRMRLEPTSPKAFLSGRSFSHIYRRSERSRIHGGSSVSRT